MQRRGLSLQMSPVVWSVCLCVFGHTGELCKNSWGDRDEGTTLVVTRNHVLYSGPDRTNTFAIVRGDKTAMQPFATWLQTLVLIPDNSVLTDAAATFSCHSTDGLLVWIHCMLSCVQCRWRTLLLMCRSLRRASMRLAVSWKQPAAVVLQSVSWRTSWTRPSIRWTRWTWTARKLRLLGV